ncbi:hypothetical protein BKA62DRAFT_706746 [Auriculariales sp. MPI-PUGE-AT-0066]|nr:hypothetical protein BKA62DRAFT_706746 [Auriculariales sp. MPI-PUGE-AT-0066]
MKAKYRILTDEQITQFLQHGWVKISGAFSEARASEWTANLWDRLGMKADDPSTWTRWKTHMLRERVEPVSSFAPKAWDAICDFLGEERIDSACSSWGDSFIVNLGTDELLRQYTAATIDKEIRTFADMMDPASLDNYHIDGDFFVHFLDSPEQALLVIPIFTPIEPLGGGTHICPTGIPLMARYLADHPEGVVPARCGFASTKASHLEWQLPLKPAELPKGTARNPNDEPQYPDPVPLSISTYPERFNIHEQVVQAPGMQFVEMTGNVGDVILLHPLMVHSASPNWRRSVRVITNPPVALKEPFCFDREDADTYSLVEELTLRVLGAWDPCDGGTCGLKGWKIEGERRRIVPRRLYASN